MIKVPCTHREYSTWRAIKYRCLNITSPKYRLYGGRGIKLHSDWVNNFSAFAHYLDSVLGPRPQNYSLDRIDNDGNYEPGNLRWASATEQIRNRRGNGRSSTGIANLSYGAGGQRTQYRVYVTISDRRKPRYFATAEQAIEFMLSPFYH